ncbi:MAG: 30S ribosomal protein S5 [Clostridiales bacterium]|nr:30S ribosomal protein S5 [Clostridiales bacterium]
MAELEKVKKERPRREREDRRREDDGFDKVLVAVRRVTKVVKGGRTMRFSAMVVVGDRKGSVGIGTGKAGEVPSAIDKATAAAKKNLVKIATCETTIPHEITGKFGASSVHLIPAKPGTGVIAGGAARSIIELAGIKDIVTKRHGSSNKINLVKATLNGLKALKTKEQIAARRGIAVEEI